MTDILLAIIVVGAVTIALAVDVAALIGWMRGRARSRLSTQLLAGHPRFRGTGRYGIFGRMAQVTPA